MNKLKNIKYTIIHGNYNSLEKNKPGSDYFVKISNLDTEETFYVHLQNAMTYAKWLEISHVEHKSFEGYVNGEIILFNTAIANNTKYFVEDKNMYPVTEELSTGKEVRQQAKKLVRAKIKNISRTLYDAGDL